VVVVVVVLDWGGGSAPLDAFVRSAEGEEDVGHRVVRPWVVLYDFDRLSHAKEGNKLRNDNSFNIKLLLICYPFADGEGVFVLAVLFEREAEHAVVVLAVLAGVAYGQGDVEHGLLVAQAKRHELTALHREQITRAPLCDLETNNSTNY
jgi:hypothetical protein